MTNASVPAESTNSPHDTADANDHQPHGPIVPLTIGAIGVVFGDIGTSPLYAFREALAQAASDGLVREEIIGVMSLMLWALILIVTVKYVLFLMRADNEGEGGVLALLALASGKAAIGGTMLVLGAVGAALFYGDAIITPALSVLSAVEGMRSIHGIGPFFTEHRILVISLVILAGLFLVQSRGTAAVAKLFGPICIVWFLALAALGAIHIADGPGILAALLPWHGVIFVASHGVLGLFVLGAV
ncbi:MAG: potassium transporter Kup, partial [Sphingomonadales bacterium]